ncbi:hypothetical protein PsYK624_113500 [Phanerochaete sordida]|uniref:Uncharacterized protein n=1 Tax=Phanerochaete sordida TaxID=48140 RepID=A0A9P3LI05_9APHY|nr:hypothetical protein PsYK624_113500 [Phanerochaete sordida]
MIPGTKALERLPLISMAHLARRGCATGPCSQQSARSPAARCCGGWQMARRPEARYLEAASRLWAAH